MKKTLLFLILAAFFAASIAEAAPARNTRGGLNTSSKASSNANTSSKSTKARAVKATSKKARKSAQKSQQDLAIEQAIAEKTQRGKQNAYGLMPSELDTMNRSVYHAYADAIRGARDTESALRYIPFITIVNTAGFGQQFDLRGQGRLSSNGLKFSINGVEVAPLDSYYGFMPINTVLPSLIQEVSVTTGHGARGGTIDIITSKRQNPYFIVGAGYLNTTGAKNSFNAFAQVSEKFGSDLRVNAGLAYNQTGGPREADVQNNAQVALGADFSFGLGQKLYFDADFFYGKSKTTPYNSFLDGDRIMTEVMGDINNYNAYTNTNDKDAWGNVKGYQIINGQQVGSQKWEQVWQAIEALPFYEGSKDDRGKDGDGIIESKQMRLVTSLGYESYLTNRLIFDIKGFYSKTSRKYDTYEIYLPYYGYLSLTGSEHWTPELPIYNTLGKKYGYNYIEQSGSKFDEDKFGGKIKFDYHHGNGSLFTFGIDSTYEMSKRRPIQILRGSLSVLPNSASNTEATIKNELDINKLTNAIYIQENYRFGANFSLMGGFRYELTNYDIKSHDNIFIDSYYKASVDAPKTYPNDIDDSTFTHAEDPTKNGITDISADFKKDYDNFAFELAPVFRYSNTGAIYARFETGYTEPPGYALIVRAANTANTNIYKKYTRTQNGHTAGQIITDNNGKPRINLAASNLFTYTQNDIEQESYMTYELGWKDYIGKRIVPLGFTDFEIDAILFAVNLFYTSSKNEFYFEGDPYSQLSYGTYDKSRRMGVELALEQYILGGAIGLNESFTYLKAEHFSNENGVEKWTQIPYTYDYKATFGGNINIAGMVEIIDVSLNLWMQNSLYGNQKIVAKDYANGVVSSVDKKLEPYLVSDLGVSVGFNKNAAMLTVGVKNVFDTFYYDYYNADRSASINENRYLIGRGRTVFLEAQYKY